MKVLLINGSPKEKGCTYTALDIVAKSLEENGIETEIFSVGKEPIVGCVGCGACAKTDSGKCMFKDDIVNVVIEKAMDCDGIVVGTPVHYAAASGAITSLMDRVCYSGGRKALALKPAAAIASCRRGGASATLDQLNKYFGILNMPIVSSSYWNMVHGNTPDEVLQDIEGVQTMRQLGKNMAWLLKAIEAGTEKGINKPEIEAKIKYNYVR